MLLAVDDTYVFPGFLSPVLTQLFFPKPPTTFPTCFGRGERRKQTGKKVAAPGDRTHNHQVMSPTRSTTEPLSLFACKFTSSKPYDHHGVSRVTNSSNTVGLKI